MTPSRGSRRSCGNGRRQQPRRHADEFRPRGTEYDDSADSPQLITKENMTSGVNLDSAIKGLQQGIEQASHTAAKIASQTDSSRIADIDTAERAGSMTESSVGSNLDVFA